MNEPKRDVLRLKQRTPAAWSELLQSQPGLEDMVVTAVSAMPLHPTKEKQYGRQVMRYILSLANHSDPISFVAKYTTRREADFYEHLAQTVPHLAPRCWFLHQFNDEGWLILEDIPNHRPPDRWTPDDADNVVRDLASLHVQFWQDSFPSATLNFPHLINGRTYSWSELRQQESIFFEEGPAAAISDHAVRSAGRLAPQLVKAANGLTVLRSLGGWPGILSETHLTAVGDLLDDPMPMLQPLRHLPDTLLHGDPHAYHWRITLFDEQRLIDWKQVMIGPGIYDLVSFLEQFELLYLDAAQNQIQIRQDWPATEETLIDTYLIYLSEQLPNFDARTARLAIPAARCLYVITNWFPYFATWFSEMPNRYTWQKVNRLSDDQLANSLYQPMIRYRPYLAHVFQRFLRAYRSL